MKSAQSPKMITPQRDLISISGDVIETKAKLHSIGIMLTNVSDIADGKLSDLSGLGEIILEEAAKLERIWEELDALHFQHKLRPLNSKVD